MRYTIIIPARYHSRRFPGKPLADLAGKPLLQHVYERARQSAAERVIIATDDRRIARVAEDFKAEVCMTSRRHENGSQRLTEVVDKYALADAAVIVNLQGDEPFMPAACLDQVAALLSDERCGMATLCHRLERDAELADPNVVKLVMDKHGDALYFSRAAIPHCRDAATPPMYYRHIGLYAYSAGFLRRYARMAPCEMETAEALEQLRPLWHGEKIKVGVTALATGIGVDTPRDLQRAHALLSNGI